MTTFQKPAKTFIEQVNILKYRGMLIADEQAAAFYLGQINYYRLGAYWLPFEKDHATHTFKAGTTFEQVLDLYVFDRELRLLVLDAIERIEVTLRTRLAYELAHRHDCHAYMKPTIFKNFKAWAQLVASLIGEIDRADEVFIDHYKKTYSQPELPPIWSVSEVMSFGQLSKWYQQLAPMPTRRAIANHFDCDQQQFEGLIQHFVYVRNLCAHHSRLWNRKFTKTIAKPKTKPQGLANQGNFDQTNDSDRKIYNTLVFIVYFMDKIAPHHSWRTRLLNLLERHPNISKTAMGFPANWQSFAIWQR
ncbi:MAG: Abi family protein [Gammaproteobacteria bacterium]|nr:Abi family protein [Gammaproteobacteria bacterium]